MNIVSGWCGDVWCGVCARHEEEEGLLLLFTLNPAEPSTAEMPLTLTPSGVIHSTLVHVLPSRLGELQQAARTGTRDLLDLTMH